MIPFDLVLTLWIITMAAGMCVLFYTGKPYVIVTAIICGLLLLFISISFSIANPPGTREAEPYHVEELKDVKFEITIDEGKDSYVDCYVKGEHGLVLVKKIKRENVTFMWGEASSQVEWYHVTKMWGPFIMGSPETICYVKMVSNLNKEIQTV